MTPCIVYFVHISYYIFAARREYLDKNVVEFSNSNPQLTVYVRQRPGKHPRIVAEFCTYSHSGTFTHAL